MGMDAFTPNGDRNDVAPIEKWLTWAELTDDDVTEIRQQKAYSNSGWESKHFCKDSGGKWRWRTPSVDDSLSMHATAIPEKPWPAPPHPGPTETTEELGMKTVKGGYPEHQPKQQTLSEAILSAPMLPAAKYPYFVDADNALRGRVYEDINAERERQIKKFGSQSHDPLIWLAILMEEVGEAAEASLHRRFGGPAAGMFRTEVLHAAAVAVAILEDMDRKGVK